MKELMTIESISQILGITLAIFGVVGGLYAFFNWMKKTFWGPKIVLSFDPSRTFDNRRDASTGVDFQWAHVIAENVRGSKARSVRSYLVNVYQVSSNGGIQQHPDFLTKLPLPWANTGFKVVTDILGKESKRIDLFVWRPGSNVLAIQTDPTPAGTAKAFGPGKYQFVANSYGDNCNEAEIRLTVNYEGGFSRPQITSSRL